MKITGVGPVTPAGIGREAFWRGIQEPVSRARRFTDLGEEFGPFVATCVDGFDLKDYIPKAGRLIGSARHTQFALAAVVLALADAGISESELSDREVAVVMGSSLIDFGWINRSVDSIHARGSRGALRRVIYEASPAAISGAIVSHFGLRGKAMVYQSSCCAGLDAVGAAAQMIGRGEADIAICGGAEAPMHRTPLLELRAAGLTPSNPEKPHLQGKPFDLWRTTGVVGEGASVMILEPETSPRRALAWIDGHAFASDVDDRVFSGLTSAILSAMAEAGMRAEEIDSINAWGPGHLKIDAAEVRALEGVFSRKQLREIAAFSIKGAIGNPLGAAGAIQSLLGALSLHEGCLPPTVNWEHPDPECALCLSGTARLIRPHSMLVNAHGVSGANTALILKAF